MPKKIILGLVHGEAAQMANALAPPPRQQPAPSQPPVTLPVVKSIYFIGPQTGAVEQLVSENPARITVPATVTIAPDSTSVNVTAQSMPGKFRYACKNNRLLQRSSEKLVCSVPRDDQTRFAG